MTRARLGAGGPELPPIGIGAMSFSDFNGPSTEAEAHAVLDAALAAGITHIDTANVYGMGVSEARIGSFLAQDPGLRDQVTIATKAGITRRPDGGRIFRNDAAHLEAELDASLVRLGVEAVDLFYIHRREAGCPIEEVAELLAGLIAKGKTRAIGFSEIAPASLRRAHAVCPVAAVQSEYSLSTRLPELGLVQTCAELGVTMVAFSPLGRGLLTDRPLTRDDLDRQPFLAAMPRFQEPNYSANLSATAPLRALAAEMGTSAAALAIAWLRTRGDHILPIPGTRSTAHFAEHVAGARLRLSESDLAAIDAILPVGWAHGDRYSADQWVGPEIYC